MFFCGKKAVYISRKTRIDSFPLIMNYLTNSIKVVLITIKVVKYFEYYK